MDSPSNNLYDAFRDETWTELGALDPDWFDVLTSREGNVSVHDDTCAHLEGTFKTPLDSQLFSTPKVFRRGRAVSPETEDERSFAAEPEKAAVPWTATQSPCLFETSKETIPGDRHAEVSPQERFDLLHAAPKSPVSYAKQVSESLGAQIHPDVSWTSSLNTPPAVPSTLILSKSEDSPRPACVSADVVFVRKLFPSLSNASRVVSASPQSRDASAAPAEAARSPDVSPQGSPSQSEDVWRQTLPGSVEDGEERSEVTRVLDGVGNVLANSSPALRKVKTGRIKRKQITPSSPAVEPPPAPPTRPGDAGLTQWSPLSLSEVPPCSVETSVLTDQPQSDGSARPTPSRTTVCGFTAKHRRFIYTVETVKTQAEAAETASLKTEPGTAGRGVRVQPFGSGQAEENEHEHNRNKQESDAEEILPPSVQAEVQGLDMSQLCRDFAQDFTQTLEPGEAREAAADAFSPSAARRAQRRAGRADLRDGVGNVSVAVADSGFQSGADPLTSSVLPSWENTGQSRLQTGSHTVCVPSADPANTQLPGAAGENLSRRLQPPSSEKGPDTSRFPLDGRANVRATEKTAASLPSVHASGFKTASNRKIPVSSTGLEKARRLFEDGDADQPAAREPEGGAGKQTPSPGETLGRCQLTASQKADVTELCSLLEEADSQFEFTQFKATPPQDHAQEVDPDLLQGINFDDSFSSDVAAATEASSSGATAEPRPLRTAAHAETSQRHRPTLGVGFKTAGGNDVSVSRKHLSKARALFADLENLPDEQSGGGEAETERRRVASVKDAAGTFKKTKTDPTARQSGFQTASGKEVCVSAEALQEADALFRDCDVGGGSSAPEHKKSREKLKKDFPGPAARRTQASFNAVSAGAFCSANGSAAPVSAAAENKAERRFKETQTPTEEAVAVRPGVLRRNGGFQTASGKGVFISPAALEKARALLSDREDGERKTEPTRPETPAPGFPPRPASASDAITGEKTRAAENPRRRGDREVFNGSPASADGHSPPRPPSFPSATPNVSRSSAGGGFCTASGKTVSVSDAALTKAKSLLDEGAALTDPGEVRFPPQPGKRAEKTQLSEGDGVPAGSDPRDEPKDGRDDSGRTPCGFTTAGGARVHVSQKSLLKARSLFKEAEDSTPGTRKSGPSKDVIRTFGSDLTAGGDEDASVEQRVARPFQSLRRTEREHATPPPEGTATHLSSGDGPESRRTESSVLTSSELSGCSEAQRRFVAQEALDCTEALLQDERLALQSFSAERDGRRKRREDGAAGQPPPKRRLLDEFDRSVGGPRGLQPRRSCPTSATTDRRAFGVSPQPHVTGPHRPSPRRHFVSRRNVDNHLTTRHERSASVPPFLQSSETRASSRRTPSAFVPPFKNQRPVVRHGSWKPAEEERAHLPPADGPTCAPPTEKTGSTDPAEDACSTDERRDLENVELARDMQDMRIRKKRRQTVRQLPGRLFLSRTSGVPRIPLKAAVSGKRPGRYTREQLYGYGVHRHVCDVSSDTAEAFRFSLDQFGGGGGVRLADGGWLIPHRDGTAGKEEFHRALCDTPGVDPALIGEDWAHNHYRWIVWKQASMERRFPERLGGRCLTPEQVLLQLKYRYDVEVDRSRRSALRKITEQDDAAAKTLVLCVCGIVSGGRAPDAEPGPPSAAVWLTDGWYAVRAQLDEPLSAALRRGGLAVGGKLMVCGAQLVGAQEACSPLEAPESLMLKICMNGTRRARWDARLGFHRDPRPFLLPVSSLCGGGGTVGCVDVVVLRSYPVQWMERRPDGGVVFRSARAEEKEARRHGDRKQKAAEILFARIEAELEEEEKARHRSRRRESRQDVASLRDGEELYEAVEADPAEGATHLSEQQLNALQTYRHRLMEKRRAELQDRYRHALEADSGGTCPDRDVAPVWRLSVADSAGLPGAVHQLSLWRPSSELRSSLREGGRYRVYNLSTSDGKKRSRIDSVQLTGTKKTQFRELQASQDWLSARFHPRVSAQFADLQNPEFQPPCGEVDLTGCVVGVVDAQGPSPAFYLADGRLDLVKIRCFSGFSQSGLDELVKPRALLALSNLQLRGQSTTPTPVLFAGDLTVVSANPKEGHLQESLSRLRNLVQGQQNFVLTAEEKLSQLVRSDVPSSASSPALRPPPSARPADRRPDQTGVSLCAPGGGHPPAAEKDPRGLKRRRALDFLSRIPSPPALPQLSSAASPRVTKTFNPPRRSGTPSAVRTARAPPAAPPTVTPAEDEWVNDEELAMIDTQALCVAVGASRCAMTTQRPDDCTKERT